MKRFFRTSSLVVLVGIVGCDGGSPVGTDNGAVVDVTVELDVLVDVAGVDVLAEDAQREDVFQALDGELGDRDSIVADSEDSGGEVGDRDSIVGDSEDSGGEGPCNTGESCEDFDPCTLNDVCREDGQCVGTPVEGCDDEIECTDDWCVASDECFHDVYPGWCVVDGVCVEDGGTDPEKQCHSCIPMVSTDAFLPDDTLSCEDGNSCTIGDFCRDGQCQAGNPDCDDQKECTYDYCGLDGCVNEPLDIACDDNDLCTENDWCVAGECVGTDIGCFDGNPCTQDSCDALYGCMHEPIDDLCNDNNVCTVGDRCVDGRCVAGDGLLGCDDGNPCTNDGCVPTKEGGCVHIPNIDPCDDGDPCTIGDYCKERECQPGKGLLECDDLNVCTDDYCETRVGCRASPNTASCDDGDPCHLDDVCSGGLCLPGGTLLACDDANVCTDDSCVDTEGCVFLPNVISCDDNNDCTILDVCGGGVCLGHPVEGICDDDNDCTTDVCKADGGCVHKPRPECRPAIVIDYPPRGATLNGDSSVMVLGHIEYPKAGLIVWFININGIDVMVDPDGWTFSHEIESVQGMNPIVVNGEDVMFGYTDHVVQSYYYSPTYYTVNNANPQSSMIRDGVKLYLGQDVWDDNDTSTPNDIATILTLLVNNLNIANLIQNPVTSGEFGWCDYKINLNRIRYSQISIDLDPVNGGLALFARIPNFKVDVDVPISGFLCPDFSGNATASEITISTIIKLSVDASGNPHATLDDSNVEVKGLNVDVDGVWGFLFNWIIDFFEDDFASMIEDAFETEMAGSIAEMVEDAVGQLLLDQTFEIPGFLEGMSPITLRLYSKFSTINFTDDGGELGLWATMLADKHVQYNLLGSIGRASCLGSTEPSLTFPKDGELEMGLHDDFFNLIPFAMYWAGGLNFPLPASMLGDVDLTEFGITDLSLTVDFLLPPILSACNPLQMLMFQVGDVKIVASMKLFGSAVSMTMYSSLETEARIVVTQVNGENALSLEVEQPIFIDIEISEIDGDLVGAEDTIGNLLKTMLLPKVMEMLSGAALVTFPIPEIDLAAIDPDMIPAGSVIAFDLKKILRMTGNTVVVGDVK